MKKLRKIFKESFYGTDVKNNGVLEFTFQQLKQADVFKMIDNFKKLLLQIDVNFVTHYNNLNKIIVVCADDKFEEVKNIAKSLSINLVNELKHDDNETSKL